MCKHKYKPNAIHITANRSNIQFNAAIENWNQTNAAIRVVAKWGADDLIQVLKSFGSTF